MVPRPDVPRTDAGPEGSHGRAARLGHAATSADVPAEDAAPEGAPAGDAPRLATRADLPAITAVVEAAIAELQRPFLDAAQVAASRALMGVDTRLVDDGTYYLIACDGRPAACGGWSRRRTAYGSDTYAGRDDTLLDPARDAAWVRAMYTHPAFARRGLGRTLLATCEAAARAAGFSRTELVATLAGEPLYRACGYVEVARFADGPVAGVQVPLVRMTKRLDGAPAAGRSDDTAR